MKEMLTIVAGDVGLETWEKIWRHNLPIKLNRKGRWAIEKAAEIVERAAAGEEAVYGVNTGFGKLASVCIKAEDTAILQRNLILSHCCGVGEAMPASLVRLMMALKLNSLGRGASGVRTMVTDLLEAMLAHDVVPLVPARGSVGASGDLAPLAHMAAAMIGEGKAYYKGELLSSADALERAGLEPIALGPKEGLALINGTQFSTAYALAGLFEAMHAAQMALLSCALTTDAAKASTAPLHARIHELRGQTGQIKAAAAMRTLLQGSEIRESHAINDPRVQDPYCIRCQSQVVGAAMDMLAMAARSLLCESNAVTDNPLILGEDGPIVSGGNFHAEPVAFAADMIAIAMSEIGAIAQRRVALLVDPTLSYDLPPFLANNAGLNSGMMIAEVTSAALMSENKHLANPCSTDSTPTSANQEDHVSMAAHGARRLTLMAENLFYILGIEIFCAITGILFRAPEKTSVPLQAVIDHFHHEVPPFGEDRLLAPDLEKAAIMARGPDLLAVTNITPLQFEQL